MVYDPEDNTDPNLPVPDDGTRDFHDVDPDALDDVDGVLTAAVYTELDTRKRDVAAISTGEQDGQWIASDTFVLLVGDDEYDW